MPQKSEREGLQEVSDTSYVHTAVCILQGKSLAYILVIPIIKFFLKVLCKVLWVMLLADIDNIYYIFRMEGMTFSIKLHHDTFVKVWESWIYYSQLHFESTTTLICASVWLLIHSNRGRASWVL